MDEPWNLDEYPLWHGAGPMSLLAQWGSPSKLLVRGDGCWVEDAAGRRYFDARAGICNVALGYSRRDIAEAMYQQALDLPFACAIRYERPALTTVEYAKALVARAPQGLTRVRLTHMGSASVENALLMARLFFKNCGQPEKRHILSLQGSFHGTTLMTMTASGDDQLHALYGPVPEGFHYVPKPLSRECHWCAQECACNGRCSDAIEQLICELGPENVAAFIIEPVMGSRVIVLPEGYLHKVRSLCDKYNILLIFDEVVTAFGRLGAMFAADLFGVTPDIMCLAKGITSGYATLGAVLTTERVFAGFDGPGKVHFANGSSTDGHPVACAVGLAVLEAFARENVIANAQQQGTRLKALLTENVHDNPLVAEVRGLGAYIGIELVRSDGTWAPLTILRKIRTKCEERGVLVHYTENTVILMPPLIISENEVDMVGTIVSEVLQEVARKEVALQR